MLTKDSDLGRCVSLQAAQLREFNRRGDPEAVIRAFESGAALSSEETLGEYVKALVKVDRLDSSSLLQTLQVRASWGSGQQNG